LLNDGGPCAISRVVKSPVNHYFIIDFGILKVLFNYGRFFYVTIIMPVILDNEKSLLKESDRGQHLLYYSLLLRKPKERNG